MMEEGEVLQQQINERIDSYIRDLYELCYIESPTGRKTGIDVVGSWIKLWCSKRDWHIRSWPHVELGSAIAVTMKGLNPQNPNLLLVSHLDTAYPMGTINEVPVVVLGHKAYAPAIGDNRAGFLLGLYAMALLEDVLGLDTVGSVTLFCGTDQETRMLSSREILKDIALDFNAAFVLEPSTETGDLIISRKGGGVYELEVQGVHSHAGENPQKGASAIVQLLNQCREIVALHQSRPGIDINIGTIVGGKATNTIPNFAKVTVDVRVQSKNDEAYVAEKIMHIARTTYVKHTTTHVSGGFDFIPFTATEGNTRLFELVRKVAKDIGYVVDGVGTGGISLANIISEIGVPVIDGMGLIGGDDHSPGEYVELNSISPRLELLCSVLYRYKSLIKNI